MYGLCVNFARDPGEESVSKGGCMVRKKRRGRFKKAVALLLTGVMLCEIRAVTPTLQCSVGVTARISPDDDFEELFNRADNVMYVAKTKGKNRYFVDRRHTPRRLRHAESLSEKSSES